MDKSRAVNIFWFRRDLRLPDNAGLYHALKSGNPVLPIFIFDTNIFDQLPSTADRRVEFIHDTITELQQQLLQLGTSLIVYHNTPINAFKKLLQQYTVGKVFTNHDYEPYARERDESIARLLEQHQLSFHTYKDQVIFEKQEVVKDDGKPYTVFTPYSKKWKAVLNKFYLKPYSTEKYFSNFHQHPAQAIPSLKALGFRVLEIWECEAVDQTRLVKVISRFLKASGNAIRTGSRFGESSGRSERDRSKRAQDRKSSM